jgi:hypothetical protein
MWPPQVCRCRAAQRRLRRAYSNCCRLLVWPVLLAHEYDRAAMAAPPSTAPLRDVLNGRTRDRSRRLNQAIRRFTGRVSVERAVRCTNLAVFGVPPLDASS